MRKVSNTRLPPVPDLNVVSVPISEVSEQMIGSPWDTAEMLWQNRRFLARLVVTVVVVATIVVVLIPNRYTSTTRIMPPENSQAGMAMLAAVAGKAAPGLATLANDFVGGKNTGALFVALLGSRTVEDRLVDRFDLRKVYWDRYWADARKDLRKRTDISEDRKSGIIKIEVTDNDRNRAAAMAQAYVEELNHLVADVSTSSARQERIFIEGRLRAVKADLDRAEKSFSEFASKNTALDIKEQTRAMVASAAQLQGELIAAQSQLEGLQQIYTPNNVRVRTLAARIAELRRQLNKMNGTDSSAPSDHANDELYPSIRKLPLLGVEWTDLYRETKVQETVYELLTQKYELARIEEAKETPVVKIADRANVAEQKSFPPRLLLIVLSAVAALVSGSAWLVYRERWERTDSQDRRKLLLLDIMRQGKGGMARLRNAWWNGHGSSWNEEQSCSAPSNGNASK